MTTAEGKNIVAAFDFDGTLTRRDTLLAFLLYLAGPWRLLANAFILSPTLLGYALKLIPNGVAKERVLRRFLRGMTQEQLRRHGEAFAANIIPGLLRPEALRRLAWHRRRGHLCVVVSASIEDYVAPWAEAAGFDAVFATRMARDGDARLTGYYDGENCYGAEKMRRLQPLLAQAGVRELYAYGDSRGDRELLALADHAWYKTMPEEV